MKFGESIEKINNTEEEANKKTRRGGEEEIDEGRRDFMKKAGRTARNLAIVGAGTYFGTGILNINKKNEERKKNDKMAKEAFKEWEGLESDRPENESAEKMSEEQLIEEQEREEMEEDDIKTMAEVLDFDSDKPIRFDLDTVRALKNNFKKRYQGKDRRSLEHAYYEMGAWEKKLKMIFRKEGVPEKLIYLAIPESHWRFKAKSPVGAAGPYQFMADTGREQGLRVDDKIDERLDPLKSGRACAKYLKKMYGQLGDWNLAVSRYNGGFAKRYVKEAKKNHEPISYENFLKYMEDRLNKTKKEIKTSKELFHKIRRGDTLGKIARRYGISISELRKLNPRKIKGENRDIIRVGDRIKLPINNKIRKMVFLNRVSGYRENLNYPAKYNAVIELIDDKFVTKKKREIGYRTVAIKEKEKKEYKIKRGDTLYGIGKKFNISISELEEINPGIKSGELRVGYKIKIPKERTLSLSEIARKLGRNLKKLSDLNPAIRNKKAPIPEKYVLRV